MLLKLCIFLITTVHVYGYRGPTFRSNNSPEESLEVEPFWIEELRHNIKQLVEKLGHKKAKTHIKQLVKETEDNNNVLLHVEVSSDGTSDIKYKYHMRAAYFESYGLGTGYAGLPGMGTTMAHPIMTPEPDPQWLADLKVFIKELIGRYGKRRLDEFVTPVIKAIQKQYNIIIKDIDVDHYGEVFVNYIKRSPFHSPWTSGRKRHTRKNRESTSESDISDREDIRGVTEIPMEKK
ncbi:uncharacterized protein LOC115453571 isoform X3 [Manduca sexta]|uniref:uncharacterized protein LOC115453571 isoform X3 n=1 Tax=Manduca sexta TaxID=7130 RepID=UPI00188FD2EE|nr:uncharacterized protein LOC115453571 isoform X3 [Manduca sexta]